MASNSVIVLNNSDGTGLDTKLKGTAGAAHVADGFKPSSYTGKVISTEAGTAFAIVSGANRLLLQSLEVTGLEEYAILAFGTGEGAAGIADAQANLAKTGTTPNIIANAGVVIPSGDNVAGGIAPSLIIGIPANATYAAIGNGVATLVQIVMVTQGS